MKRIAGQGFLLAILIAGCNQSGGVDDGLGKLKKEYEEGVAAIAHAAYEQSTHGDRAKGCDAYAHTTNLYSKIVTYRKGHTDALSRNLVQSVEAALHKRIRYLMDDFNRQKEEGSLGSYSGIFFQGACQTAYDCAIRALLQDKSAASRWLNVCDCRGVIADVPVVFKGGYCHAKLKWRIFERKPYMDWECEARINPTDVFAWGKNVFALAQFGLATEESGPTTTQEVVLLEIKEGTIVRMVGLNNFLKEGTVKVDAGTGIATLEGTDGFFNRVRYGVDLKQMKILGGQSVFSREFSADYRRLFVK